MAEKKKAKLRIDRIIICALILIALIVGIVFLIHFLVSKTNKPAVPSPTTPIGEEESQERPAQFLDITQTDCSMVVGGRLQLICKAEPAELVDQVTWSTTNEMVLTVSDNGFVQVVGEGTAAIVAVAGTFSDSVIIVGIAEDSEQSTEYPVASSTEATNSQENPASSEQQPSSSENPNDTTKPSATDSNATTEGQVKPSENDSVDQPTVPQPSSSQPEDSKPTDSQPAPLEQPTTQPVVIEDYSDYLNEAANRLGMEAYYAGTYIYREDGNYLGEVIVSENMTQVMVKMRTSSLDGTLKNFLASVLPTSYEAAYAKMLYAGTTTTMRLDGLTVRVIVNNDATDSHKQLIIYY